MDQLKVVLALLKKHHFWLIVVLCMICGVVGWMMASKSLSAAYVQKKGNIVKAFNGLQTIQGTENFPNAAWKDEVAKITDEQRQKVREAWELVYNEQRQILKWPAGVLGPDFVAAIDKIPWGDDIPAAFRRNYAILIKNEVPNLLKIIRASVEDKSAPDADKGQPQSGPPAVVWANAGQLQRRLTWGVAPESLEVWLAQEDLWVYAALLTIISKVNGEDYVLKIRTINSLLIGAPAAEQLEQGLSPGQIDNSTQTAGGGEAAAVASGEPVEKAPDEGRYVDKDGKRLPPGAAAKAEFKRMPVFMKLTMDQRAITKLLVECANSPLPVDVRHLRVNPSKPSTSSGGSSGGDKSVPKPSASERESYDVPVELAGIIYIYNKPDASKLGAEAPAAAAAGAQPQAVPALASGG